MCECLALVGKDTGFVFVVNHETPLWSAVVTCLVVCACIHIPANPLTLTRLPPPHGSGRRFIVLCFALIFTGIIVLYLQVRRVDMQLAYVLDQLHAMSDKFDALGLTANCPRR